MVNRSEQEQKRIEKCQAKIGDGLAKLFKIKKNKLGYYETTWGPKTSIGLYLTVIEFLKNN